MNGGLFPLLFPDGGAAVGDYVQTPAGAVDEDEDWRLSVEGALFDESTGAGLISLKLEDKSGEGGQPSRWRGLQGVPQARHRLEPAHRVLRRAGRGAV